MSSASEIHELALKLPQRSRLKLASDLLRSASPAVTSDEILNEASRRNAEIEDGSIQPLSEAEFWNGVIRRGKRAS